MLSLVPTRRTSLSHVRGWLWLLATTIAVGVILSPLKAAGGQGEASPVATHTPQTTALPTDLLAPAEPGPVQDATQDGTSAQPPTIPRDLLFRTLEIGTENRRDKFSLLRLHVGADNSGNLTFDGSGQFFGYLNERTALQVEAAFESYTDRREGQFDLGLVKRIQSAQVGLFSSFKYASLSQFDEGGLLAQATATVDYLLPWGRVGLFGTKGLRDRVVVQRREVRRDRFEESLLQVVDQVGLSGQFDIFGESYLEGNVAYLNSAGQDGRGGGRLRLVVPAGPNWAVTAEGGWNETLVADETNGRVLIGVQLGLPVRPRDVAGETENVAGNTQGIAGDTRPVPVDIPRIRYEVTTRGVPPPNGPPVADAGPDQIDVPTDCVSVAPCTVTIQLDGSGSFDREGDELTYLWEPRSGFDDGVAFAPSADSPRSSFIGQAGKRYVARLTVSDGHESDVDEVTITIAEPPISTWPPPLIVEFTARPPQIFAGDWSDLHWTVQNATHVTIDQGIGDVAASGMVTVDLWDTTVYTIRATNDRGQVAEQSLMVKVVPRP